MRLNDRVAVASASLAFSVDSRPPGIVTGSEVTAEGWCFAPGEPAPPRIVGHVTLQEHRRAGERRTETVWELEASRTARPDVGLAYPGEASASASGFLWTFPVRPGYDASITIVAEDGRHGSVALATWDCTLVGDADLVPDHARAAYAQLAECAGPDDFQLVVDQPAGGDVASPHFQVIGWCRHLHGQGVSAMRARLGDTVHALNYGDTRSDVHRALGFRAGTLRCGFSGLLRNDAGATELHLDVQVLGRWLHLRTVPLRHITLPRFGARLLRESLAHRVPAAPGESRLSRTRRALGVLGAAVTLDVIPAFMRTAHAASPGNLQQHDPRPIAPERFPPPSTLTAEQLPRLTIVTPSFNQGAFLRQTMTSVLEQEGVRVEYIVMDGGSSDESPAVIRAFSDRLAWWVSEPDRGQSDAVVRGFAQSSGAPADVLAYLNSDDVLLPGALRYVAEYFHAHPEVDALYGHRVLIDADGCERGRWYTHRHSADVLRFVDLVPQETLFWRRGLYDRVGGIDPSFRFALDWDLLVRFVEAGARMTRVPYFLACFRVHEASKTSQLLETVGAAETARIRRTLHGREVSQQEIMRRFNRACAESAVADWLMRRGIRW